MSLAPSSFANNGMKSSDEAIDTCARKFISDACTLSKYQADFKDSSSDFKFKNMKISKLKAVSVAFQLKDC
jgi:hypothetical protein